MREKDKEKKKINFAKTATELTHTRTSRRALRLPIRSRDMSSEMSSALLSCEDLKFIEG
jgi:hypothetical protein